MTTRIRLFGAADAQALAALVADLNRAEGYDPAIGPDAAALLDAFLGDRALGTCLVAEGSSGLVGYVTFHPTFEGTDGSRGAYVGDLFVVEAARRRGIGRALMAAAARAVRSAGGTQLWWTALPANETGRAFYARLGAEAETIVVHTLPADAFERLADEAASGPAGRSGGT